VRVPALNRSRVALLEAASEALEWARIVERVTAAEGDARVCSAARQLLAEIETRSVQLAQREDEQP
jgi:hypothetical protein